MSGRNLILVILIIFATVGGYFYYLISNPGTSMGARWAMDRELRAYEKVLPEQDTGAILVYILDNKGSSLSFSTVAVSKDAETPINGQTDINGMILFKDLQPGRYKISTPGNNNFHIVNLKARVLERVTIVSNQKTNM